MASRIIAALALTAVAGLAAPAFAQLPLPDAEAPPSMPLIAKASKATFPVREHDFGNIFETQPVEFAFPFTNTGEGKLIITQARGSCGCTVPALDKTEYNPGEGGVIKVRYDPHNRSGPQRQTITVTTNDPESPVLQLTIAANVKPLVAVEPRLVSFGQLQKGDKAIEQIITVTGRLPNFEATLGTIESQPDRFIVKNDGTKTVTIDGEELRQSTFRLSIKDTNVAGPITDTLVIRTNDDRASIMRVQVAGLVQTELDVQPPRLPLGLMSVGEDWLRDITVVRRSGEPFEIKGIENTRPETAAQIGGMDVKWEVIRAPGQPEKGPAAAWIIRLSGKGPANPGPVRGSLVVKTNVPGEEKVEVGYMGTFRAGQ